MQNPGSAVCLFIAGDSTAADCPEYEAPMAGWGQLFQSFFTGEEAVVNKAAGGRSCNSFIEEGRLDEVWAMMRRGDYLFIQFGHNDQKSYGTDPATTYPYYLEQYIQGARGRGAYPVLLTSVNRRKFDEQGIVENTLGSYPEAMIHLAKQLEVPLIDMWAKTKELYEHLGEEGSKKLFVWLEKGEHQNYPNGIQDDTHFNEKGAYEIGKLIANEIKTLGIGLEAYLIPDSERKIHR
ncbi:rhamnogalacturonan acetylesterase [Gracilibacillus sp. Marseille-QA3620]